jgi:pyruvate/2-oxoglutarate dehydrogenase complex dihydrolipoamide acyltransferase (E2) component
VRVLEWHAQPGYAFAPGDLVVELETHKALVEVRAGQAGVLRKILSAEGDWAATGRPIALFSDDAAEALPDSAEILLELLVDFEVS